MFIHVSVWLRLFIWQQRTLQGCLRPLAPARLDFPRYQNRLNDPKENKNKTAIWWSAGIHVTAVIYIMTNSTDPDQLASCEANWSGSTLFAKAGHIRDQQDQGYGNHNAFNTRHQLQWCPFTTCWSVKNCWMKGKHVDTDQTPHSDLVLHCLLSPVSVRIL